MILVRLYPFVYMDNINGRLLLYNTLHPSFLQISVDSYDRVVNREAFLMQENGKNQQLAEIIIKERLGQITTGENAPLNIFPGYSSKYTSLIHDYFSTSNHTNAIDSVKRVFVSLSKSLDVLTWSKMKSDKSMTSDVTLLFIENISKLPKLKNIGILVDIYSFNRFLLIYEKLSLAYRISIYVYYTDYQLMHNLLDKTRECEIHILLQCNNVTQKIRNDILQDKRINSIHIFVRNSIELKHFQKEYSSISKVKINCCNNADIEELKELLEYSTADLLEQNLTIDDIIRNEWLNFNFWGDLYVDAAGTMLLSAGQFLGNIKDWDKIPFENLLKETSLWRKVRGFEANCQKCLFRNICPPISLTEIINNVNFCNSKLYENQ